MKRRTKVILVAAAAGVVAAGSGAGVASAVGGDEAEASITGVALEKATAAALEYTGGGRVTDTEIGDEDGYYEVEVTTGDGRQVDVHLDRAFTVLGSDGDVEGPGDDGEQG